MERKQIIGLVVALLLLSAGSIGGWVMYVAGPADEAATVAPTDFSTQSPALPPVPLNYELKVTSPRISDIYSLSRPENILIEWEYPSHLVGKDLEQRVALVSHTSGAELIDIKSPMYQQYLTLPPGMRGYVLYAVPSEIPPGNYWIRVILTDRKTSAGYIAFSEPFVVQE